MLLIPCPWCGERSESEFRCAGPVRPARQQMLNLDDAAWIEFLCHVDTKRGQITEYWQHEKGCGEWFKLRRNTVTHEVTPVE